MLPIKVWNQTGTKKISLWVDEEGITLEQILIKGKSYLIKNEK